MRFKLDKKGEEDLDKAFDDFLVFIDRVKEESKKRTAETGEKPRRVLFGVDRKNRRVAIVPVDPPSHD